MIFLPWPYSHRQCILNEAKIGFFTHVEIRISTLKCQRLYAISEVLFERENKTFRQDGQKRFLPWPNVTEKGPIELTEVLKSIFHLLLVMLILLISPTFINIFSLPCWSGPPRLQEETKGNQYQLQSKSCKIEPLYVLNGAMSLLALTCLQSFPWFYSEQVISQGWANGHQ